jgi:O-antigen ligase
MLTGDFGRGAVSVIIFLLMFITLAAALPHALQQWGDAVTLVRAIAAYGVVFVIANVAQFVVNPAVVEQNSRFFGTTGNPQHAGAVLACVLLPMAYLMTRPGRSKATRLFMSAILSATVIFLLWTGSRTALLMAVVGLGLLFRARLGRLAIGGVVVGGLVLLGLNVLLPDRDVVSERLVSTLDTRSVVWQRLTDDFLRNPLFGTISGELGISENSYLSILARFGLVGALPFIVAAILITRSMFKLQRVRRRLDDTMLADLTTAGLVQLAVGAIFEGFLAGTLSPQVLVMYCYLALLAFLLEAAEAAPVAVDSGYDEIPDEFRDHVYGEGETVPASTW